MELVVISPFLGLAELLIWVLVMNISNPCSLHIISQSRHLSLMNKILSADDLPARFGGSRYIATLPSLRTSRLVCPFSYYLRFFSFFFFYPKVRNCRLNVHSLSETVDNQPIKEDSWTSLVLLSIPALEKHRWNIKQIAINFETGLNHLHLWYSISRTALATNKVPFPHHEKCGWKFPSIET